MILTFGKFKGRQLEETPQWYQNWLNSQDWFEVERGAVYTPRIDYKQLRGWDGYSERGQAIYDQLAEQEMEEENRMYCDCGEPKDPNEKFCGFGCIAENNPLT